MITLRDYQVDVINRVRETLRTMREPLRVILQAETGSGKTVCALQPIKLAYEKGKRVLFICRGRELVNQADAHLWEWGIPHGVIMRGEEPTPASIHICSKDTLVSWAGKRKKIPWPPGDLIILDECHETQSKWWLAILAQYPNAVIIGLTATPVRADGRSLSPTFGAMVQAIPTSKLIAAGHLVPTRVFAPFMPDLKGVPTQNGDYAPKPLAGRMDQAQITGDIVTHWLELGQNRQTIAYAVNIAHALSIQQEFLKAGVKCEHVDGSTPIDERDEILARLESGEIRVVTSVGVLCQGVDICPVSCAIDAQPTKSFGRARQKWGRIKRPSHGKTDCLVLDHAGNVYRHGMPDMDVDWTLEPGRTIQEKLAKKSPEHNVIICANCHAAYSGRRTCPNCGAEPKKQPKQRENKKGKLVEISSISDPIQRDEQARRTWHRCLAICFHKNKILKAAAAMFKSMCGLLPWDFKIEPMPARDEWSLSVQEKYPGFGRKA